MDEQKITDSSKDVTLKEPSTINQPLIQESEAPEKQEASLETINESGKKASKEAKAEQKNVFVGQNVFTNDGNFLQRFKRAKDELDEKDEREKSLKRKQELEKRIKNRGRRRKAKSTQLETDDYTLTDELNPAAAAYLNEMKQYSEKMGNI